MTTARLLIGVTVWLVGALALWPAPAAAQKPEDVADIIQKFETSLRYHILALQHINDRDQALDHIYQAYASLKLAHKGMAMRMNRAKAKIPAFDLAYNNINKARETLLQSRGALKRAKVDSAVQHISESKQLIELTMATIF